MDGTQRSPRLPTEVYAEIVSVFRSEQELIFLWTVLRNVSHLFRDLVDEFVRRRHLPETQIIPQLDTTAAYSVPLDILSPFLRISVDDPAMAVFDMAPGRPLEDRRAFMRLMNSEEVDWRRPRTIVAIRRHANDTELPDAQWNEDTCELRVNWRGMFGAALYEEKLRQTLSAKWVERTKALKANALASNNASSESNALLGMVTAQRGARDESQGQARQMRVQRQMRRKDPEAIFTPIREDIYAFETVEMIQQTTNAWDFDD